MKRKPGEGLLIHSDRGVQYASRDFRSILEGRKFVQSMSRKGNCRDNAVAESFFHTIKTVLIHHRKFQTIVEAEQALFNWIEVYYNRRRKHSTNNQKSPAQYELEWRNEREVA
jgi:putative transposase